MSNQPNLSNVVIAGASSGYKVVANPSTHAIFQNLESMAGQGNHWAQIAVKEICSLQSGAIKNNVYVSSFETKNQLEKLTLFLPGCKVHVLKRSDGSFFVHHVEMSTEYKAENTGNTLSGMYEVRKQLGKWSANPSKDGEVIELSDKPIVVISDGYEDPNEAAIDCANHASEAPIGGGSFAVEQDGFNMHFHKGVKIGGLRNIQQALSAESCPELHTSALHLAHSMASAHSIKTVCWISQAGGSGVLTQAMRILKDKGFSFRDSNHHIYFSHLTTNLGRAETLAKDLGFKFVRQTHKVNKLNLNEMIGGLRFGGDITSALCRKRYDPNYTYVQLGSDLAQGTNSNLKTIFTLSSSTAAVTAAIGLGGTALAVPATIAMATAVAGAGKSLFKAWLPERYRRLTSKL